MEQSAGSVSAARALPVVLLHRKSPKAAPGGHEADTIRELARQIAELKGTQFAGEFDEECAYPAHRYLIPDDTLTVALAHKLGVRSVRDLYGGVVPFPFVATKLIAHGLADGAKISPPGWSRAFSSRTASLVLPGYSAFSREDARNAARGLWEGGPVRVKRPYGIGGAGQAVVANRDELEAQLDALGDEALRAEGIVIERHLDAIETFSVGQIALDDMLASYYGVQHLTVNNHGNEVYGGSDLVVVRGCFDALVRLDLPQNIQDAIAKARAFDAAVHNHYAGFFASRRNYDVAHGLDEAGVLHCGVLEQSWRVGGATGAEIGALRTFRADPDAYLVRASTREIYGEDAQIPAGACMVYRGVDAQAGHITKYYTLDREPCKGAPSR
ncbi:DUF3182 family protein [Paraburkholderia rhynchosiae]|uniref:DUF3182 domain-containing protein n=1 Tax=Paraburkholderia rhynchosiae TaxID=487049 RepID=A0A2N7WIS9_9BURK|nr:DUF3182 family protein [Paraburkholderia rhynchosiae]PMS29338.1 DUF3182 domain-containing protein [Paraburkholderia rhynchosiae]CAB3709951.1 hypothetical protein LMG27174_04177 [Paraburkholderia rhynchosiae]